ncbi:hypothetical protein NDA02_20640 [Leptolyngbya sp. ST-U4]|nr:hypothetical protein [Leptolyngbya sp. FACHB-711]
MKNDHNHEVFNGDLSIISAIDTEEQELLVRFGKRDMTHDYANLDEITREIGGAMFFLSDARFALAINFPFTYTTNYTNN